MIYSLSMFIVKLYISLKYTQGCWTRPHVVDKGNPLAEGISIQYKRLAFGTDEDCLADRECPLVAECQVAIQKSWLCSLVNNIFGMWMPRSLYVWSLRDIVSSLLRTRKVACLCLLICSLHVPVELILENVLR
jgi:hypothetical protein